MTLPQLQSAFDGIYPPRHQWYWRADFFDELSDAAIEEHVNHAFRMPTMQSSMHLYPIDGAGHDVKNDATPWSYREANWAQVIVGVDPDPAQADTLAKWAKAYWQALHAHSSGGAYVNFMMDEGQDRVRATYRDNHPRLARIKAAYDPNNLFRVNQNIEPNA
ncbi:MAG: BBE domain-containing protein [Trueperaceae bacterium]